MEDEINLRSKITLYIVALYLIPLLLFSGFSVMVSDGLLLFSGGLLATVAGSIFLIIKMWQWEGILIKEVEKLAVSKAAFDERVVSQDQKSSEQKVDEDRYSVLLEEIENLKSRCESAEGEEIEKNKALEQLTSDQEELQKQYDQLQQEFLFYQESAKNQLKQKEFLITEYAQAANDLRENIEKKQKQVSKLETSVQDLTYEIKTLLSISPEEPKEKKKSGVIEPFPEPKVKTIPISAKAAAQKSSSNEAMVLLKRCIDIAQKLTGASHIGMSSRFRDVPIDSYALDQRRLFDTLSSETSSLVFVYSQREKKMLFANNETKGLFGWSPDKFIHDFHQLIQGDLEDWSSAISKLAATRTANIPITIKSRSGNDQCVQCTLGIIPTGVFKNHIIGVAQLQ